MSGMTILMISGLVGLTAIVIGITAYCIGREYEQQKREKKEKEREEFRKAIMRAIDEEFPTLPSDPPDYGWLLQDASEKEEGCG